MRNPISTPRVLVSPKAVAVASYMLANYPDGQRGGRVIVVSDGALCADTGLSADALRRALSELRKLGAIKHEAPKSGRRKVHVQADHWLWAAVAIMSAAAGTGVA